MGKIKVGIIGCGTIANSAHIPNYMANKDVEIKYFCDIIPERAEDAVKKYGCGKAVTDYHEVLADDEVDAISVCTPNNMHSIIAIDALNANKHVLCEKPAARTYDEALKMKEAQNRTGKILNIGVVNRFNDGVNVIKRMIDSGELGEVFHVYVSFRSHRSIPGLGGAFTTKAIAGGGALIDWGVHFLDIVMYCCGDPKPRTVTGETFCKLGKDMPNYVYTNMWAGPPDYSGTYDVEDSVTALIRSDGPVITVNGAWAQNIFEDEMFIDFMGTKGGIRLYYGREFKFYTAKNGALMETTPVYRTRDHFANEIDAFVRCIKTGEKLPSHIDTVIITAKIMQAIYDSAEQHREIVLD
ncbi:oxidoreductase [Clostridium thermosuccinogenes]|uniref:Oxidoreductase n=1 Tax=Clostridium thermosuccinogenes TaxID=84032 RepID=A0A2K2FAC5_9CLOT|nr:Gfo/Idh/MocA family oxidoreductase [Pseudoclostridium thermosuccinogenes]AUS95791.1 oxidoreductase [Pseudoclostridium thermosuccinogenes]PNT95743.1 oxidoreductase [Pseudoclostridium thermosuccinogenes]PNT97027.1 oxidoreductase [Pseudoclostridium thermosuccinogenes]